MASAVWNKGDCRAVFRSGDAKGLSGKVGRLVLSFCGENGLKPDCIRAEVSGMAFAGCFSRSEPGSELFEDVFDSFL